jgi:hypothetical protein
VTVPGALSSAHDARPRTVNAEIATVKVRKPFSEPLSSEFFDRSNEKRSIAFVRKRIMTDNLNNTLGRGTGTQQIGTYKQTTNLEKVTQMDENKY